MARTIFNMKTPVISAVGHETDFTISDFVADLRAPTPSAAAELVTPELDVLKEELAEQYKKLGGIYSSILENYDLKLQHMKRELSMYNPMDQLRNRSQRQDDLFKQLVDLMKRKLKDSILELENSSNRLKHLSPANTLDRGYSILLDEDGNIISSIDSLDVGRQLDILMKNGILKVKVVSIKKGEFNYG